jgi:hypothetical protein
MGFPGWLGWIGHFISSNLPADKMMDPSFLAGMTILSPAICFKNSLIGVYCLLSCIVVD